MDTEVVRERLERLLVELDGSARTLQAERGDNGDLSHEQESADSGSGMSDADREDAVIEVVDRQTHAVRAALARVEAGTYGSCVDCRAVLPDERLEARPEAERCVHCQQQSEAVR
ncbi:MAG TPA: TraR/DksA C4-type zinc finger protein [Mycobacteriales bacterium]|nr:TraR/DksA C4-type zinc finger protein [Mycobacteriales bacterium]